jgi:hypothetical protein
LKQEPDGVAGAPESVAAPRNIDQTNPKKNASLAISTDVQSLTPPKLAMNSTEERLTHYELGLHTGGDPNRDRWESSGKDKEEEI